MEKLPFILLIGLMYGLAMKRLWDLRVEVMHAQGMYTVEEWADRLLRYSRANDYISLEDLEKCFKHRPRDERGRLIYMVRTDWWGVPLDFGLRNYPPELTLGYYTDGQGWAQITIYYRDKDGQIQHYFRDIGEEPLSPPGKEAEWKDRSWFT